MDVLILILIIFGATIMLGNIFAYLYFLYRLRDVLSSGSKKDAILSNIGFALLVFFLAGYIFVAFTSNKDILVALLLFFGSIFVSLVIVVMSHLLSTAKTRSLEIADALIGIIDARDPNLHGHSRHVKNLTMLFYSYLPHHYKSALNPISLEFASLMHDVGKLEVPEGILNKPAKLNDEEWAIMKMHPKYGVKLLKPIKSFDAISDWILYHHERIDGNGYYKQEPSAIPLASKIISIADTYSAITMRRSYKDARSHEEAIKIIKEVAGTQLDKDLVEIFVNIPKEKILACIPANIE